MRWGTDLADLGKSLGTRNRAAQACRCDRSTTAPIPPDMYYGALPIRMLLYHVSNPGQIIRCCDRLQAKRKREKVGELKIVVAGCVAQQEGQTLLRRVPEVDIVMGGSWPWVGWRGEGGRGESVHSSRHTRLSPSGGCGWVPEVDIVTGGGEVGVGQRGGDGCARLGVRATAGVA